MRTSVLIAILFCFCGAASAQDRSLNGSDLLASCIGYDTPYSMGECHGYIMAIADAMEGGGSLPRACISEVTSGQLRDTIVAALRRDPENGHLPAAGLTAKAIAEAFPCH